MMSYVSINPCVDFSILPNGHYVFFFAHQKKYLSVERSKELDCVIDFFVKGGTLEKFYEKIKDNENAEKTLKCIKYLLSKEVMTLTNIQKEFNFEKYVTPELAEDFRYGYQNYYIKKRFFNNPKESILVGNRTKMLKDKTVAIIGLGAIGSLISMMLGCIGVGNLLLVDGDKVSLSNLSRQFLYSESDVDLNYKVDALAKRIHQNNREVNVTSIREYILGKDGEEIYFENADLIIQTADSPSGRIERYVNDISKNKQVPVIFVHNGSIGPLVLPGITKDFSEFETYLDADSNGMYLNSVNYLDSRSRTAYPTMVHDLLHLTQILFDFVLEYLLFEDLPDLQNAVYYIETNEFIPF